MSVVLFVSRIQVAVREVFVLVSERVVTGAGFVRRAAVVAKPHPKLYGGAGNQIEDVHVMAKHAARVLGQGDVNRRNRREGGRRRVDDTQHFLAVLGDDAGRVRRHKIQRERVALRSGPSLNGQLPADVIRGRIANLHQHNAASAADLEAGVVGKRAGECAGVRSQERYSRVCTARNGRICRCEVGHVHRRSLCRVDNRREA